MSWAFAVVGLLAAGVAYLGITLRRSWQRQRLMAESVDAMVAQLRSTRPTPIMQPLRDLSDCLAAQRSAATEVAFAVVHRIGARHGSAAVERTLAVLASVVEPVELVDSFIAEHLEPSAHQVAAGHLHATSLALVDWSLPVLTAIRWSRWRPRWWRALARGGARRRPLARAAAR